MNELQRRRELARKTKGELMDMVVQRERTIIELADQPAIDMHFTEMLGGVAACGATTVTAETNELSSVTCAACNRRLATDQSDRSE